VNNLRIVWGALLGGVVMFAGVAWVVGPQVRSPDMRVVFAYAMLGMAVMSVVASQVVARVLPRKQATAIVSFALSESAGLVSCVAYMVTGAVECMAGVAISLVSLASLFPKAGNANESVKLMP
jgi:hypothetical protein